MKKTKISFSDKQKITDYVFELGERVKLLEQSNLGKDPRNYLESLAQDLEDAGIKYCVIGGVALSPYSYQRMTQDIDIIVSKNTFNLIEEKLIGRGYMWRVGSRKNFRITTGLGMNVDVLVEGQKENGIHIPNPLKIRHLLFGVWYATLIDLIVLKLQAGRPQDLVDVQKLVQINKFEDKWHSQLPLKYHDKMKKALGIE